MTARLQGAARPCTLARAAALACLSPFALANLAQAAPANQLDPIVVTATRSPQRLSEVLADLTVITREDIERQAFGSLADLLRNSGCVEMVRNGGPAGVTSLYLRGAETRHTLVLLDGVRIDSQGTGGASWPGIPLAQVERIEVLKGPASAIYGSDAVGGVVHIISRKGQAQTDATPRIELGAAVGNLDSGKLSAAISGGSALLDYALTVAHERSKGFNATTPQATYSYVPDVDGWRSRNATLRLGAAPAQGQRVELVALASHLDSQYDASSFSPTADDHALQDTRAVRLSWSNQWSAALRTELSAGEGRDRYRTQPSPYETETRLRDLSLLGSYRLDEQQQLNFQLEHRQDRLDNASLATGNADQRSQSAVAAGWIYKSGRLDAQVHVRHDDYSQFGGVDTGTLAAGYRIVDGLRLRASVGNAFRAPTLYQRASVYGPDLTKPGVKPLDAERGRNVEIGLRWEQRDYELSATAYRNRVSDLIVFGAAGTCRSPYGCYENVSEALLQGLSLAAGWRIPGVVNLAATLDLQAPKNSATGLLLARRAKQFGTLRADKQLGDWTLGAAVQASGQRWDNAGNTRALGGYGLVNLDAQYKLSPQLRLQLNVDNAFDRSYQTAYGYAQTPRMVFVGLRYANAGL